MNLYFLVEGKQTERKVYPKWLSYLLPQFSRVDRFDAVTDKNYVLYIGDGYPSLLHKHLPNAVKDFNKTSAYSHLVVCLDAEETTVAERQAEVEKCIAKNPLAHGTLEVIVQNRSMETWFLGNRRMLASNPQSSALAEYIRFLDVKSDDPEQMPVFSGFSNHAKFHFAYLRKMFAEKNLCYSKQNPGHVMDKTYLQQLLKRIDDQPQHLKTFQSFVAFCRRIDPSTLRD